MSFGRLGAMGTGFGRMGRATPGPWWFPGATLDLDFARGRGMQSGLRKALSDLLSTTRASTAYADNAAGTWSAFSSGIPRITDKGLLVEESRTNSIRNNSMQGAVAGTPGTLPTNWSQQAVPTGLTRTVTLTTINGIDVIEVRYVGVAGSTRDIQLRTEGPNVIAALNAQVWANSMFFSTPTDTGLSSLALEAWMFNAGSSLEGIATTAIFSSRATFDRKIAIQTLNDADTAFVSQYLRTNSISSGTTVDITFRIGWPQLELGSFATSPIRTTSAAATRAADVITANNFSSWFNATTGTLYAEVLPPTIQGLQTLASLDDGSLNERFVIRASAGLPAGIIVDGGATQANMTSNAWSAGATAKAELAYAANDAAFVVGGGSVGTDASVTLPTVDRLLIGSRSTASDFLCGYIRRVAYFPTRLTNAQLQALTQ